MFPLFIMLILIIINVYWNYDKYSDLRKRFKGYRNIAPEPFEIRKHNFIIYGPPNSGKTTSIKDYCGFYETVNVFCIDSSEWKGYNVNGIDDLKLLDNLDSFANSLIIFDDMGENIRLPAIDSLYSKGRHHNINIICVGHTVTDLNTKARENTPAIYITLNSSQQFFERLQEKFKIDSNLYRFKHYNYGVINYNTISDYYIVLDKDKNVVYDSRIGDLDIEKNVDYTKFKEKEYNILSSYLTDRMIEPTHIKPKEIIFYFEEYLEFKEINKSINLHKIFTNIKSVLSEIHSGYIVLGGAISLFGIGYSYFQSSVDNKDNNINGIDIMNIDKAKIKLKKGKNMSIGYGITDENKIDLNDPFTIVSALASCLVGIYATHNHINSKSKNEGDM